MPTATGDKRGQARAEVSAARERTWREGLGRRSESISDFVFGTGSLSALVVLMISGNAAQADPVDGKGGVVVAESFVGNTEVL